MSSTPMSRILGGFGYSRCWGSEWGGNSERWKTGRHRGSLRQDPTWVPCSGVGLRGANHCRSIKPGKSLWKGRGGKGDFFLGSYSGTWVHAHQNSAWRVCYQARLCNIWSSYFLVHNLINSKSGLKKSNKVVSKGLVFLLAFWWNLPL